MGDPPKRGTRIRRTVVLLVLVLGGLISLMYLYTGGFRPARTYRGIVLDSATNRPLAGVELRCSYTRRGTFSPTLDGFFRRRYTYVTAVTDAEGRFEVTLAGFNRRIQVLHPPYDRWRQHVTDWPSDEELVIRLKRAPE
ncbi:MAG TPA: hypothetical protein VMZ92_13040 [Planctomycetota bacterium]|nr:hypothetical protein [Planctomycetota bacterium]